jgi:RNA polymerase sigma-70 factor (ECF subfamily)
MNGSCFQQSDALFLPWPELQLAEDADLLRQLALGNGDAFGVIVDRYHRLVFSVASRIVKDEGEAEDVTQTVFLDVFRKLALFDPAKGTMKTWLLQFAYTRSVNRRYHLQQQHFYSKLHIDEITPLAFSTERSADRWLTAADASRCLTQALACLKPKQRQAIELISLEGLTFQEAAQKSGESLPSTRHNYYRGMVKLRGVLLAEPQTQSVDVSNLELEQRATSAAPPAPDRKTAQPRFIGKPRDGEEWAAPLGEAANS